MNVVELLSDAAILAACAAAAAGCLALNRRVRRLASTELGIGKALSEMSRSVAQFEALLAAAEESTRDASAILDEQLAQARKLVARLEAIAGAAHRPASTMAEASRKAPASGDPLSDVVPKGAARPEAGKRSVEGGTPPNGSAQMRLADLALRRRATNESPAPGRGSPA
jgi:hypothetical protein